MGRHRRFLNAEWIGGGDSEGREASWEAIMVERWEVPRTRAKLIAGENGKGETNYRDPAQDVTTYRMENTTKRCFDFQTIHSHPGSC